MASVPAPVDVRPRRKKCAVCQDTLRTGRVLPCEHRVCLYCLRQYLTASGTSGRIFHCPSCRRTCEIPEEGIGNMPKDEESCSEDAVDLAIVTCANANHGTANIFCTDCREFYCKVCASSHDLFEETSGHTMRPVDGMAMEEINQARNCSEKVCTEHGQRLTIQCKICKEQVCITCTRFKHREGSHQLSVASSDCAGSSNQSEQEQKDESDDEELSEEMARIEAKINEDAEKAARRIKETTQQLHSIIDNQENEIVNELTRYETQATARLQALEAEAQARKARAILLQAKIHALLQSGDVIEQVMQLPTLQEEFKQQSIEQEEGLETWNAALRQKEEDAENIRKMLGTLNLGMAQQEVPGKMNLGSIKEKYPLKYTGDNIVSGMIVLGDCLCVTHSGDPHLWLYNLETYDNQVRQIPNLRRAEGMDLLNPADHTLVITEEGSDTGRLHFVRISTQTLDICEHHCRNIPLKSPRRVSVDKGTKQLLIGQSDGTSFIVCNEGGDVEKTVTVTGANDFFPWCVRKVTDGYAAIMYSETGECVVRWMDEDGACSHIHMYGCGGNKSLNCAYNMVQDRTGRFIVVDYGNNKVHLVDAYGRISQDLLSEEDVLSKPQCVYINENNARIYVACDADGLTAVKAYKWSPHNVETLFTKVNLDLKLGSFKLNND